MDNYWTSNKPIKGLRHFVVVNKTKKRDKTIYELVSVLDVNINLKIPYEELANNVNWEKGWINLPKSESISTDYTAYKFLNKREERVDKILINHDSLFNIS